MTYNIYIFNTVDMYEENIITVLHLNFVSIDISD